MNNELQNLIDTLKIYTLQYAIENGIKVDNNGFCVCFNPEHDDHDPSMHYWAENNIFHCFACNVNYDVFALAHLFEGKPLYGPDFIEDNVFYLAERYGLEYEHLKKDLTPEQIKKYQYYQTMKVFADYIVANRNKEYLESRKIQDKTAIKLQIGSVKSYDDCHEHLVKKGCNEEIIKEIGILPYFVDEQKMIFVIKDEYGRACSFVSREMGNRKDRPKYINGKATCIFDKSRIFYLWSDIKREFNTLNSCIIVEGYIDAVTAYQAGYRQFVALGSASFTDEHIKIIEKSNKIQKVLIALDNDVTGKKRMNDLIERLKNQKTIKEYEFAIYREAGKDIDEIINSSGGLINLKDVFDTKTLFDFELMNIQESYGETLDESVLFDKFITIISKTKRPKEREEQARSLAKYLNNYSYQTILDEVKYIISEDDLKYKKQIENVIYRSFEEIKSKTEYALPIIDSLKDSIEEVNLKFKKSKGDLFEQALEDFDKFEVEKQNYNLFNIKFDIPWFDDLSIYPGSIVTISALPNVGKI